MTAATLIKQLRLAPHPEGGYYRETYRGRDSCTLENGQTRDTATAIYYLLNEKDKSHFHRVLSDEIWLFHLGAPLEIILITRDGTIEKITLSDCPGNGATPQFIIAANTWFAAHVKDERGFALVSCIVAPGFEFSDFELGRREELLERFPNIKAEIMTFTPGV